MLQRAHAAWIYVRAVRTIPGSVWNRALRGVSLTSIARWSRHALSRLTEPDPDDLARSITALGRTPALIALDGRSGSGKSRLAEALACRLEAVVVSGDDFYAGGTGLLAIRPAQRAALCIDWRRQCDVLERLRSGQSASFAAFDWDAFDGSHVAKRLDPAPVVILEGTYSGRPALRRLLDLTILVTAPDQVRAARLLAREGTIGAWERQWHEAEDWYFAKVMPPSGFDIVVESRGI